MKNKGAANEGGNEQQTTNETTKEKLQQLL